MAVQLQGSESGIHAALRITGEAFREAEKFPVRAHGSDISYSVYGLYHRQVALPRALGKDLLRRNRNSMAAKVAEFASRLVRQALPFCYTVASIALLAARKGPCTAIWTGDFLDPRTGSDFRVGHLYRMLREKGIRHVEFIRTNAQGTKSFWKNVRTRRRPAIYYDSLSDYLGWLFSPPYIPEAPPPLGEVYSIYRSELIRIGRAIPLMRAVFRLLGVGELVAWEYSDRQASLIHAARGMGIPVLGFMHGAGMQSYMAHEFIPEYRGAGPLGPDYFGVWSKWWKEYFESRSRVYGSIEVSGTLRKSGNKSSAAGSRPAISRILWISEPLAEVREILPFLEFLSGKFSIAIKKRPSTFDLFYNALVQARPEMAGLETRDGDIFEAMQDFDLVAGSHSTAVIDASWLNKPFIMVHTGKWGDYFELADTRWGSCLFAKDPAGFLSAIDGWERADASEICGEIREMFYGDPGQDGCEWLAGKILGIRNEFAHSNRAK